jgi:hypothetical protein
MDTGHSNSRVYDFFLNTLSGYFTPIYKSRFGGFAITFGVGTIFTKSITKEAELRYIVEGLAMPAKLLEGLQTPMSSKVSELFGGTLSFEQFMQLKMGKDRIQFELEHEKMRAGIALEREKVKTEQFKLEQIRARTA